MIHPHRLLVLVPLALSLSGCGQTSAPATTTTSSTTPDTPSLPFEKYTLAERPRGHPVGGPSAAARGRRRVVPRRARERSGRAHGLRASLRAHDVSGLEARAWRLALQVARSGRRHEPERHDRFRSHELLRDAALESARARVCGSSPIAWAICSTTLDRGQAREPAGRRAQRAPSERRERAVRRRR